MEEEHYWKGLVLLLVAYLLLGCATAFPLCIDLGMHNARSHTPDCLLQLCSISKEIQKWVI
jgi:hypothetical protein